MACWGLVGLLAATNRPSFIRFGSLALLPTTSELIDFSGSLADRK